MIELKRKQNLYKNTEVGLMLFKQTQRKIKSALLIVEAVSISDDSGRFIQVLRTACSEEASLRWLKRPMRE